MYLEITDSVVTLTGEETNVVDFTNSPLVTHNGELVNNPHKVIRELLTGQDVVADNAVDVFRKLTTLTNEKVSASPRRYYDLESAKISEDLLDIYLVPEPEPEPEPEPTLEAKTSPRKVTK